MALCKVQTVCFEKLAASFESDSQVDSTLRRIQRYLSEYMLDSDLIIQNGQEEHKQIRVKIRLKYK